MAYVTSTSLEEKGKKKQSELVQKIVQTDIENDGAQMVSGIDHPSSQYDSASIIDSDPCHIVDIDIRKPHSFISGKKIHLNDLWELILEEKIPVTLSAVAVLGLPDCGKSVFLKGILENEIRLSQAHPTDHATDEHPADPLPQLRRAADYMDHDDKGLSSCTLCVLGGQHYGDVAWSLASRRFGVTYSVLGSIIRRWKYLTPNLEDLKFCSKNKFCQQCNNFDLDSNSLNNHLKWIFAKVENCLSGIKNDDRKQKLLGSGFSLVNVFDAGVNKAMYDFLPYIANYCDNLVRIVMFSMERDAGHLHEPPCLAHERYGERGDDRLVMQWRPRIDYIMHFASLGYQPNLPETKGDTIFIGSWEKKAPNAQLLNDTPSFEDTKKKLLDFAKKHDLQWITKDKHWIELVLEQSSSLQNGCGIIEQIISKKIDHNCYLPIKFMFLRSLLSSYKNAPFILEINEVKSYAARLKIFDEEFEEFLKVFLNYGSILYFKDFPSLKKYVIVNIFKFTQSLGELYYPPPKPISNIEFQLHSQYGILIDTYITECLLSNYSVQAKIILEVITELGMIAEIKKCGFIRNRDSNNNSVNLGSGMHYFLPSARIKNCDRSLDTGSSASSVYLYVKSDQFPANVQANIASAMINTNIDMVMIPCDISNVMFFESTNGKLTIKVTYFGMVTEIKMERNQPEDDFSMISLLTNVLSACCTAMSKRQQQIRNLDFGIGIKCLKAVHKANSESQYHFLYYEPEFKFCCEECQKNYRNCTEIDMWVEAGKKCSKLLKTNFARMQRAIPLEADECACVAEQIAKESEDNIREIGKELGLKKEELDDLKKEHGSLQVWRPIMELIFKWEKKSKSENKGLPPKQELARILKKFDICNDIVSKLDPKYLSIN